MNTTSNKVLSVVAVVVVGLIAGYVGVKLSSPVQVSVPELNITVDNGRSTQGGTNYNRQISFDEGIAVDNATFIDGNANITTSGTVALASSSRISGLVQSDKDNSLPGITISTTTPNTAFVSALQVCTNPTLNITNVVSATGTITLPSSSAMFAIGDGCLTTVGDFIDVHIYNASTTSGNLQVVVSDQSSTLKVAPTNNTSTPNNSTSSLNFGNVARLTGVRVTTSSSGVWLDWYLTVFR